MEKLRILQVGVGGFGKSWVEIIKKSPEWELSGIVDINKEVLFSVAKEYNIPQERCFTSLEEGIKKTKPSAIMNATPPKFHKDTSIIAFDEGLNVLTEKPLSDNIKDAQEMVAYAQRKNKKLMVSQNYRYRSQPRTVKNLIEKGTIGRISYIVINFQKGPRFVGFREKMDYPLLVDMAIHHFDLMRYITGENPVSIYAKSWNPYWSWFKGDASSHILIEFEKNIEVSYSGSWVSTGRETSWDGDWEIYGEKGTILWKEARIYVIRGKKTKEIKPIKMKREERYLSLYEFYCALAENREPETSGRDNLHSLSMVFGAIESAKKKRPITF